jgi:hypothetical protein
LTCFDDDGRVELRAWPEQRLDAPSAISTFTS